MRRNASLLSASVRKPTSACSIFFCLVVSFLTAQAFSQGPGRSDSKVEVNREVYLMGTQCRLQAYAEDRQSGIAQLEALLGVLEKAEEELSTWRPDSLLSRLNRHPLGSPFPLKRNLFQLFAQLFLWSSATQSAFDPAIGTLVEAWDLRGEGRRPSAESLQEAREQAGVHHLELDANRHWVARRRPVTMDAGGFGKGEALDRLLAPSLEAGYDRWLVDLGGQVMVHGLPPEQDAWEVDLAHPLKRRESVLDLRLVSGTLATSGGSERDLELKGVRIGHILDPRTGLPAAFQGSVTVWHPRGLVADILSTALYVMGVEQGLRWAESQNLAACYLTITEDSILNIRATSAFRRRFFNVD